MLNELNELATSLEKANILTQPWDTDFRECPNNKTFLLLLSDDGSIGEIENLTERQRIKSIRKWEISNGTSFPAFNVKPLLHAKSDEAKSAVKKLAKLIKKASKSDGDTLTGQIDHLWDICDDLWTKGNLNKIEKCIAKATELQEILGEVPEAYQSINALIERSKKIHSSILKEKLRELITEKLLSFPDDPEDWIALLVSSKKAAGNITLILEVLDRSSFEYPASNSKVQEWINLRLIEHKKETHAKATIIGKDAFGEVLTDDDTSEKFPSIRLPSLGDVILRAMNPQSPCQKRYKQIGPKSYPAAASSKNTMKDSLTWLGAENRRGKTWAKASGLCGFTNRDGKKVPISGILFAYPSSMPKEPVSLARMMIRNNSDNRKESRFEAAAEHVIEALTKLRTRETSLEIRVFALSKLDKARTKVLVNQHYTAESIIAAAKEWQKGCRHVPPVKLNLGTDKTPSYLDLFSPYPSDVVKCLNLAWTQNAGRSNPIHGLSLGEGLALLMEESRDETSIAARALHLLIINVRPLMIAAGHIDHRRDGILTLNKEARSNMEVLPKMLGLLLYKLGQDKEEESYMDKPAFLVGQVLALSDLIHKGYCICVRDGGIPPRLLGNSLISTAMDNPERGLVRLGEKLPIYKAWADTAKISNTSSSDEKAKQKGKALGLAKWALRRLGDITPQLSENVPQKTTDADKAQMILGYLARSSRSTEEQKQPIIEKEAE